MPIDQLNSLIVSDPRSVFSVMSYCSINRDTQSIWLDASHHRRIIEHLTRDNQEGVEGISSAVPSDLFFGSLNFSVPSGSVGDVELDRVYSRPRLPKPVSAGDYVLELRDGSGSVLRSIPFAASQPILFHIDPSEHVDDRNVPASFGFTVFDPPDYASFAIKEGDEELLVVERSASTPSVSVSGVSEGQVFSRDDTIDLSWVGADADGDSLSYRVYYSIDGGTSYEPFSLETSDTSKSTPASRFRGSDRARFGISVSDGFRSSFVETPVFRVVGAGPEVQVVTPSSGLVFAEGQGFVLEARGYDQEDGLLGHNSFSWRSSIDGDLGAGGFIVLSADQLTPGTHAITVEATDSSGLSASASTTIMITEVNSLPVAMDDVVSVGLFEFVVIDILANDIDIERDVDRDSFKMTMLPTLGEVAIATSPTGGVAISYVGHTSGFDSFGYEICDGLSRCDTAVVSIEVGLADCTILGTEGEDDLLGTTGDDVICGLGGDDFISARGGNDVIRGGAGDDEIYGRVGNDEIYGGLGDDLLLGHRGSDVIFGGLGDDRIFGGPGMDTLRGEQGADVIFGEPDNDILEGGEGNDMINGGDGDDIIRGGEGDDTIRGNQGADTIYALSGVDTVLGVSRLDTVLD